MEKETPPLKLDYQPVAPQGHSQSRVGWLLREPLLHFLALGGLLFVVFGLVGKTVSLAPPKPKIEITPERVEQLILYYKIDFKKTPTPEDVKKIVDDYIREEVLCREAWAQGIDRDEPKIRLQLKQIMEGRHADQADMSPPTDEQLKAFVASHPEVLKGKDLEQNRTTAASAYMASRRKEASDAAYERLKQQYIVVIDSKALPSTTAPTPPATAEASKP